MTVVGATERRDFLPLRFSLPIPGRLFSERVGKALIFPLPGEEKRSVPCRHEAVSVRIFQHPGCRILPGVLSCIEKEEKGSVPCIFNREIRENREKFVRSVSPCSRRSRCSRFMKFFLNRQQKGSVPCRLPTKRECPQ